MTEITPTSLYTICAILAGVALVTMIWVYIKWPFPEQSVFDQMGELNLESARRQRRNSLLLHAGVLGLVFLALLSFRRPPPQTSESATPGAAVVLAWDVSQSMQEEKSADWCKSQIANWYGKWADQAAISGLAFGGQVEWLFSPGEGAQYEFESCCYAGRNSAIFSGHFKWRGRLCLQVQIRKFCCSQTEKNL